jgi:hypothetical protein
MKKFIYSSVKSRSMNKKAIELAMQTIVVAAIALVVLAVVIIVFGTQISKTAQQYLGISEQAAGEANVTNKCQTMFGSRVCAKDCQTTSNKTTYVPVPGDWADCKSKSMVCCERLS